MQTIEMSKDLGYAVDVIEEALNCHDGQCVIDLIRKYKQTREVDESALLTLRKYLR